MDADGTTAGESLATSRSRRTLKDKHGRKAAFERLKGLKGSKNKYEVAEITNVYEEVNEKEYCRRRQDRIEDDWIVDDDGSGYVEDGREIFDEENEDDSLFVSSKDRKSKKRKESSGKAKGGEAASHGSGSIKAMLMNVPTKRKKTEPQVRLDDDDVLGDILQDLGKSNSIQPPPLKLRKAMPTFKKPQSKPIKTTPKPVSIASVQVKTELKPGNITQPATTGLISPSARRLQRTEEESCTPEQPSQHIDDIESMDVGDVDFSETMDDLIENDDDNDDTPTTKAEPLPKEEVLPPKEATVTSSQGFTVNAEINDEQLTRGWETVKGEMEVTPEVKTVHIDSSQLPLTTNAEGKQVFRFYWIDAYEEPFGQGKGTIYLLGKVWVEAAKTHASCCVVVKNIDRKIYLLPRKKIVDPATKEETEGSVLEVYREFSSKVSNRFNIKNFKSKKVTKSYCFGIPGIPKESDYLEVCYPAEFPPLPSDLCGRSFSHVFGTNTSFLELFLLERKIMGPCWLDIMMPQLSSPPLSWCKIEAVALKPENLVPVSGLEAPPVVVMTLNIRKTVKPKTIENEICMISCLVHQQFPLNKAAPNPPFQSNFCAITHPSDVPWPWDMNNLNKTKMKLHVCPCERALLNFFLTMMQKIDPDVVVGYDLLGHDLTILLDRMRKENVTQWSRLGKLRRTHKLKAGGKSFEERTAMCGRLLVDVKISAKELIHAKSYELPPLISKVLRVPETQVTTLTPIEIKNMYESSASLYKLYAHTMNETVQILRLMCELYVLPLALQITTIAGNVMSRTLVGGRSERNEYLLLHAFTEKNFIVPDKTFGKAAQQAVHRENDEEEDQEGTQNKGRRKPGYTGGLVLDPKKGFYDNFILLMDFKALYPSVIQEYNICFTTVDWGTVVNEMNILPALPDQRLEPGVLPTEIRKLVESRQAVKSLMKGANLSKDLQLKYDIRQKALKLTANSMYGCLGFSHSRFYGPHLASLVTGKGREVLLQTRDLVTKMNLDVIYGDTDSIMINSKSRDFDQVFRMGDKVRGEVNKLYKKLELEMDGMYKYMLLLKKKKYAALALTKLPNGKTVEELELKGLDIVRRDWAQLASDCGKHIITQIFSDQGQEERIENIHTHLTQVKDDLKAGKIALDKLAITKSLTKKPQDYGDPKQFPHVQVALRMNQKGLKTLRQGDTVAYVICEDGSNLPATQRAYHVDEVKSNRELTIDMSFYLSQQIYPVISRLCDPIEGTDASKIAECLGLDPSSYKVPKQATQSENKPDSKTQFSPEEYFRTCERFSFKCPSPSCDTVVTMESPLRKGDSDSKLDYALLVCPNPRCNFPIYTSLSSILNKLRLEARKHIKKYYQGWFICEDPSCENRTRRMPVRFAKGFPICNLCQRGALYREYTAYDLYRQLLFYGYIFDIVKAVPKSTDLRIRDEHLRRAYTVLYSEARKFLDQSAYSNINMNKVFGAMAGKPKMNKG